jgi:RimJ/RimL family protein N-acetyltransferase
VDVKAVSGERVALRPWTRDDADWYVDARDDAVFRFTTEREDLTIADVLEGIERARASPTLAAFAIDDESGRLVGNLAIEIDGDRAELSYFLAPAGRGRGLATDAVRTAVGWLAGRGIRQVVAVVMADNARSARVVQRAGFAPSGPIKHPSLGHAVRWVLHLPPAARRRSPEHDRRH